MTEHERADGTLYPFDEDEVGCVMSTNFIGIRAGLSVRGAMKELINQAAHNDNVSMIYVVDESDIFVGAIYLKDLIVARDSTELTDIICRSYPSVYVGERIERCMERIVDYSEDSIPVLDGERRLCGVLTSQDIARLVDDELGDDYAKLGGLAEEEDLCEPLPRSISKRLPWLIVLLGLGLIVSGVVGVFESVVSHITLIVSFQSLVLGMSGNAGTQSLAVTIRVLTDEHLDVRQKRFLIGKEARVGLVNGLVLGALSFVIVGAYLYLLKAQTALYAFSVSSCTGIALIISVFLASVSGTVIPIVFKRLNIDPAVASGPLITTVNDLVAVVAYYGTAWLLLITLLEL